MNIYIYILYPNIYIYYDISYELIIYNQHDELGDFTGPLWAVKK